jgi:hypothetical protein
MIVVVLGLRRSGTSLVAGLLHHSGVFMGERFAPLDPIWNTNGSFEDLDFGNLINNFAKVFHVRDGYILNPDADKIQDLQTFIGNRAATHKQWGVKGFGLLYLLPEFARHCPEPPKVVVMRRQFASSVNSYFARTGYNMGMIIPQFAHDLYNLDMVYKTYAGPKIEVQFESLIENPTEEVETIASFCGVTAGNVASLIDPMQRRF